MADWKFVRRDSAFGLRASAFGFRLSCALAFGFSGENKVGLLPVCFVRDAPGPYHFAGTLPHPPDLWNHRVRHGKNILEESARKEHNSGGGSSDDDAPSDDEMKLLIRGESNRQINLAAQRMVEWLYADADEEMKQADFDSIAAFRAAHAYPLRVVTALLRQRAKTVDSSATVYARAKRMISIIMKLQRTPTMQVTTMQDIGGCRAVVDSIGSVARLTEQFRQIKPELDDPKEYDYITKPKPDGYRSIHFVVKYRPRSKAYSYLPSRRIEIQIRSALQHPKDWRGAVFMEEILHSYIELVRNE